MVQAPLNFFCCAVELFLIWKKPPWKSWDDKKCPPDFLTAFFKPPWKQKSKINAPLNFERQKPNVQSAQKAPFFQGGIAHQKCYARVWPGHRAGRYAPELKVNGLGWDLCVGLLYEHRFAVLIKNTFSLSVKGSMKLQKTQKALL